MNLPKLAREDEEQFEKVILRKLIVRTEGDY
jgi:hypothetical protein